MLPKLNKIKGIHPGALLKWVLENQNLTGSELASKIGEHKQTLSAIINKKRSINPGLSIKLSKVFGVEEDYFMILQASYDVKMAAEQEEKSRPNISNIRKALFWDTDFQKIDWIKNKRAIIKRILERGNKTEIEEIISFYGKNTLIKEAKAIKESYLPTFEKNLKDFNLI
ncbi:MAG: HigA family addiction module antitoxin [Crocinitomicaceae bacterium]